MALFGRETKAETGIQPVAEPTQELREATPLPAASPLSTTVIAEGVKLTGDLQGNGVIHVEGTVEGQIKLMGRLIVAQTGAVKGPVEATVIQVAGSIEGNVSARDQLRLESTGVIDGDVTTASFVIEDGGCLNGRTSMEKPADRGAALFAPAKEALPFGPDYKMDEEEDK